MFTKMIKGVVAMTRRMAGHCGGDGGGGHCA